MRVHAIQLVVLSDVFDDLRVPKDLWVIACTNIAR